VPTPFYHLSIAEELLAHHELSLTVKTCLDRQLPAFLLGNTAPDVQTVSQQARRDTHFFDLPPEDNPAPPWEVMLEMYPQLAQTNHITESQTAFLAGYICHLQADWLWINQIFEPVFGRNQTWEDYPHRLYIHNVLRAYLDRQILADLPFETGRQLGLAQPEHWLPFVEDRFLNEWRDFLSGQLRPGANIQTVEVFAARQGLAPELFYQVMDSESNMARDVFSRLSLNQLKSYRQSLVQQNIEYLTTYLQPALYPYQREWQSRTYLGLYGENS